MKNKLKLFFALLLFNMSIVSAQVGIGNNSPQATLDVNKITYAAGEKAGIAITQQTGAQIVAMSTSGLKAGTIVYATTVSGVIDSVGYWYYNGTAWSKVVNSSSNITASNGITATSGNVALGGTLVAATTINQGGNNLTFSGTGTTIVAGSFQTQGRLYAKAPRVHPIASSITWLADDVVILLQSTHTGNIVFPSASANPNRLIGINNRSGSARIIENVTGGDTGIYADEALSQIATASGVSWYVSDGTSWRLYSGRP